MGGTGKGADQRQNLGHGPVRAGAKICRHLTDNGRSHHHTVRDSRYGVGLFRQSNGYTYLRNSLTTGYADNTFTYGIAGDVPVAGHWQLVYPPRPNPVNVLVPPTAAPVPHIPFAPGMQTRVGSRP